MGSEAIAARRGAGIEAEAQVGRGFELVPGRLRIERTDDPEILREIIFHPRVYPWISDDSSVSAADWKPPIAPELIYLVAHTHHPVGFGAFIPRTGISLDTHLAFLPEAWGAPAQQAFEQMKSWIRANTPFLRLTGEIWRANRLAIRFVKRAGAEIYGINDRSMLKNGQRVDRICFGLELD